MGVGTINRNIKVSWKNIKISDFAEVTTGGTPPTTIKEYWENGTIPWLNSGELNQDIITTCKNYITDLGMKNSAAKLMPQDTVLIALTGATTGVIGYLTFEAAANQSVTGILPSTAHHPKYLYYYLKSIREKVLDESYGGAQKHISQGYVKELEIPLPPLPVQKRIAEILDTADTLRRKDQELLKKYDELAQAIFIDMFGDPVKNEKGWEVKRVGSLTKVGSGSTPSRSNPSYFTGNIPWVKTTEVNGGIILLTEESISSEALQKTSCKLYPINCVIIAMYGQGKTRGQVGLLGIEAATNQACGVIMPCEELNPKFLFHYLKSQYKELRELGRGGNQENLNKGMIEDFYIIVPPLHLQNKFKEIIDQLIYSSRHTLNLKYSDNLFNSLLQKAFKGELLS
jgi:type I restriction enzyme S subunit